jgi:hypothetical protein
VRSWIPYENGTEHGNSTLLGHSASHRDSPNLGEAIPGQRTYLREPRSKRHWPGFENPPMRTTSSEAAASLFGSSLRSELSICIPHGECTILHLRRQARRIA